MPLQCRNTTGFGGHLTLFSRPPLAPGHLFGSRKPLASLPRFILFLEGKAMLAAVLTDCHTCAKLNNLIRLKLLSIH